MLSFLFWLMDGCLQVVSLFVVILWLAGDIRVNLPPNSRIYDFLLWFKESKNGYKIQKFGDSTWMTVPIDEGSMSFHIPHSVDWVGTKISVLFENGYSMDLNLPDGSVFDKKPASIGAKRITLTNTVSGNTRHFYDNEKPYATSLPDEL